MPISGLNVGRDNTIDVFVPLQGLVSFNVITSFDAKMDATDLKSKGMDGVNRHGTEYDGWSGSIGIDRKGPNVDTLFALFEEAYFNGINIDTATITQTVQEPNGSVSQFRFTGVTFKLDDAGNWQNGKFVAQKISWRASRRLRVV